MENFIVTDLTCLRENVCLGMINTWTGECIRPKPFLTREEAIARRIVPGALITTNVWHFNTPPQEPHLEDRNWDPAQAVIGETPADHFRSILEKSKFETIKEGFGYQFPEGDRLVPLDISCPRSLITIKITPANFYFHIDSNQKTRITFTDNDKTTYNCLPLNDLGFKFTGPNQMWEVHEIQEFIRHQPEVYLRLGLGRPWKADNGDEGYWVQVNGIYSFPEFFKSLRKYGQ